MFDWKHTPLGAFVMFSIFICLGLIVVACAMYVPAWVIIVLGASAFMTLALLPFCTDIGEAIKS